jgi:hypothetical protein
MQMESLRRAASLGVTLVMAAIGWYFGGAAYQWLFQDTRAYAEMSDEELRPVLQRAADEINATAVPRNVDEATVLIGTSAGPQREFTYHYQIPGLSAADIDRNKVDSVLGEHLIGNACSEPGTSTFLKGGISINFAYADKGGTEFARFTVHPSDCGKSL